MAGLDGHARLRAFAFQHDGRFGPVHDDGPARDAGLLPDAGEVVAAGQHGGPGRGGVVRLRGLTGGQGVEDGLGVVIGQVGGQAHPCGPGLAGKDLARGRDARPHTEGRAILTGQQGEGVRAQGFGHHVAVALGQVDAGAATEHGLVQGLAERPAGGRAGQGQGEVETAVVRGQDVERVVHVAGGGAVDTDEG